LRSTINSGIFALKSLAAPLQAVGMKHPVNRVLIFDDLQYPFFALSLCPPLHTAPIGQGWHIAQGNSGSGASSSFHSLMNICSPASMENVVGLQ
jgi:hypothetical protein